MHELDGADCASQSYGSEIEHAFGVDELTVVERETVAFERTEDLLNAPAQTIKLHDLFGLRGGADRMGGEKPPQQRSLASGSINLAGLDQREFNSLWSVIQIAGVRTRNESPPGTQGDLCDTALVAWSRGATFTEVTVNGAVSANAPNSLPPSASLRSCAARTMRLSPTGLRANSR